ncbi:MAG: flagellar motor switch protein FliG [Sphingomonadaceae bacterium]|nr:flagellar motor switch protein FliG [Sphingomonadaceae bacterium]
MSAPQTSLAQLTGEQKSAIILLLLGEEQAAALLGQLSPREVQAVGHAMFAVASVGQATVAQVLDEFVELARAATGVGLGAEPYIRSVLSRALGEDRAQGLLTRITPADREAGLDVLQWMDARAIAELVQGEHPQVIAAVLTCVAPELAGEVLELMPPGLQPDLIRRVATLEAIPPEGLAELERVLQRPPGGVAPAGAAGPQGGVLAAARIMNHARSASEQRILRALAEADPELGQAIQDNMLTFDQLRTLDDKSLGALVRAIEQDVLVLALKGADERLRARLLAGMTQRAAQTIEGEMETMGPVRLADVQEAQKSMLATARQLAEQGAIMLGRSDDFV